MQVPRVQPVQSQRAKVGAPTGGSMKTITGLACVLLAGCATSAAPNFFNGNYYMAGDATCKQVRALSPTRVMCIDKKGNDTGYRDALTAEQLQMYHMQMQYQQAQAQLYSQELQRSNQALQNSTQQLLQQSQQYTAPQVAPITPPGGYQTRCLVNGIYVSCRSN